MYPIPIVIITEEDPFYVYEFFKEFLDDPRSRSLIQIEEVVVQTAFRDSKLKLAHRMWDFWGPIGFLRVGAGYLLRRLKGVGVERLLKSHGIRVYQESNVNSPKFLDHIRDVGPRIILSVAAPQIFKKLLLEIPELGCINVHSGPLPQYRGMLPTFWQLLDGRTEVGITVHSMAPEIDGGDILKQEVVPIGADETLDSVIRHTKRIAAHLVLDTLVEVAESRLIRQPMDMGKGSYFSFPKREDVRKFKETGRRLI